MTDTADSLISYSREKSRVCPMPMQWDALWNLLPNRKRVGSGWEPALPLILAAWHDTPAQCNIRNEIAVIKELTPTLLLVPSTKGKGDTDFLIKDLIKAANAGKADVLNFTHFGFIQNKLPIYEIQSILDVLFDKNIKSSIRVIIWDIDFRFKKEMKQMWALKNSKM